MQTKKRETVEVVTLGCSKNTVDSEKLLGQLRSGGVQTDTYHSAEKPSIVVINTCGFIQDAKEESIDTILGYIEEKRKGNIDKVFVMGCLAQRYKDELLSEIPEMDGVFGLSEVPALLHSLGVVYHSELLGERFLTTRSHTAYLKVSEGCDHRCSFCAIPLIRGKHISRPQEEIILESESLVNQGVKELILIAQDLTYYGIDLYKKRALPDLVGKIAQLPGLEWLRLHYTYPAGFPFELLEVIKASPTVCKYIDIPIQHINDRILRSMQRGITRSQTIRLLESIRRILPEAAIRTTLIAGYPGETDKEFKELRDFIEAFRFDRLGIFTYSHEEDTPAFHLRDDIPEPLKRQRADEIMRLQEDISYSLNSNKIGSILNVLIEEETAEYYIGRTEFDSPEIDNEVLILKDDIPLHQGNFYSVMITGAENFDLFGKVVS